ncbi:MAG: vWA domain-containing protein, partial [Pseudomonadota bacterium]
MIYQSCSPNRECVSAEVEDARISQRARVLRELGNVDIVFLIDRSRSMGPYFASTAEAIRIFVRDRLATQTVAGEASVRIGVMAYSDYTADTPSWEGSALDYLEVVPMHDPGGGGSESLMRRLEAFRTQEQRQDRNNDFLEAPFAALIRTARETRWRPDARQRIIIHLADHGNREAGQASPERPNGIRERYSVRDVVAALGPQEQGRPGINYIPIMVEGQPDAGDPHAIAARAAFAAQSREIARQRSGAVTSEDALTRTTPSTSRANETLQQRRDAVLAALATAQERHASVLNHLRDMQACARMPNTPECQNLQRQVRSNSIPLIRANNQILLENGFSEEEIARDQNRVQTVRAVWVPPVQHVGSERREVLTYWVALDQQSFRDIREAMGGLCRL